MKEQNDLLSTAEAGALIGVSDARIRQFIQDKRLPALKIGKFNVVRRADLDKLEPRKNGRPKKEKLSK